MFVIKLLFICLIGFCLIKIIEMLMEDEKIRKIEDNLREINYIEITQTLKKDLVFPNIQNINTDTIAIINTKTNNMGDAIAIGVTIVDTNKWQLQQAQYYIISEALLYPHTYDNLYIAHVYKSYFGKLCDVENHIRNLLTQYQITNIYAYNAQFVLKQCPGLDKYYWHDIMKIAAYQQHNPYLPSNIDYLNNGRIKYKYNIPHIMEYLNISCFRYTDHALYDTFDELRIMQFLKIPIHEYDITCINQLPTTRH